MKTIRTLLVDDEAPARRRMKKMLNTLDEFELVGEAENGRQAIELIGELKPNLLLLDIQLKDMTGFDVLSAINTNKLKVIFITAFDSFAIKAFEQNAIDYLLKPYKDARFLDALDKVKTLEVSFNPALVNELRKLVLQQTAAKIEIQEGKTVHLITADKLAFIKSDSYYCNLHFDDGTTTMLRTSLKALEQTLPGNFVRINKSVIVNKDKIVSMRKLKTTVDIGLIGGNNFSTTTQILNKLRN